MSDKEIFMEVFSSFQRRYNGLEIVGTIVYYKGEMQFNTDGFILLYNLARLCSLLKEELR